MNTSTYARTYFYVSILFLLLYLYISLHAVRNNNVRIKIKVIEIERKIDLVPLRNETKSLKYILLWTLAKNVPFVYMGNGTSGFRERNCTYTNCFVTDDRDYLGDYTKFDVIAFAGPEVVRYAIWQLPLKRSPHQKFAFASIESADNYPMCMYNFNSFFNWTWTYKLDSDAKWGYIVIRDKENKIVGPKKNMHWIAWKDMKPTTEEVKERLKSKTKAAAWFVSNCRTKGGREKFELNLEEELSKYDLEVDVYGRCGSLNCSQDDEKKCNDMIETDYYFYLSFENSFAEDYATEKLLHPLNHLAVPIVYGGANYSRFMPDGVYLNANTLGVKKLAEKMYELIQNPDEYAEYFRWRNHYSYHKRDDTLETNDYCRFCSMLNEEELVQTTTIYENFQEWWNPPNRCTG